VRKTNTTKAKLRYLRAYENIFDRQVGSLFICKTFYPNEVSALVRNYNYVASLQVPNSKSIQVNKSIIVSFNKVNIIQAIKDIVYFINELKRPAETDVQRYYVAWLTKKGKAQYDPWSFGSRDAKINMPVVVLLDPDTALAIDSMRIDELTDDCQLIHIAKSNYQKRLKMEEEYFAATNTTLSAWEERMRRETVHQDLCELLNSR